MSRSGLRALRRIGHGRRLCAHAHGFTTAQDSPNAGSGPSLVRLRRLLQAVRDPVHDRVDCFGVEPYAAIQITAEELREASDDRAGMEDSAFELVCLGFAAYGAAASSAVVKTTLNRLQ